jgi:hypothetical protein
VLDALWVSDSVPTLPRTRTTLSQHLPFLDCSQRLDVTGRRSKLRIRYEGSRCESPDKIVTVYDVEFELPLCQRHIHSYPTLARHTDTLCWRAIFRTKSLLRLSAIHVPGSIAKITLRQCRRYTSVLLKLRQRSSDPLAPIASDELSIEVSRRLLTQKIIA